MRLNRRLEWLIQVLLGAGSFALLGFLIMELTARPEAGEKPVEAVMLPDGSAGPVPPPRTLPTLGEYAAIVERPLFAPTRAPYSGATAAPIVGPDQKAGVPADAAEMILTAVLIAQGQRLAILESGRGKSLHKVAVGESVNGWTLMAIEAEAVSLKKGNEVKLLELRIQGSPAPGKRPGQEPPKPAKASEIGPGDVKPPSPKSGAEQSG